MMNTAERKHAALLEHAVLVEAARAYRRREFGAATVTLVFGRGRHRRTRVVTVTGVSEALQATGSVRGYTPIVYRFAAHDANHRYTGVGFCPNLERHPGGVYWSGYLQVDITLRAGVRPAALQR